MLAMIGRCQTDPSVFGLPCRFPAGPSIVAEGHGQVYDPTRFSAGGGPPKKFSLSFPARQGTGVAGPTPLCRLRPLGWPGAECGQGHLLPPCAAPQDPQFVSLSRFLIFPELGESGRGVSV